MGQLGPDPGGEVDGLGSTRQHRLRADVDAQVADVVDAQLAAHLVGTLEHDDVAPGLTQVEGGDQPADAGPDDGDAHQTRS